MKKKVEEIKVYISDNHNIAYDVYVTEYNDGQQAVKIIPTPLSVDVFKNFEADESQNSGLEHIEDSYVDVEMRLHTFKDLEILISINAILKEHGAKGVSVSIPYLLGARSDRKFGIGETNYIKNVISPIINAQEFKKVKVFDPHSDVVEACINNFEKFDNIRIVKKAISIIQKKYSESGEMVLVSPDAGALKKIHDVAEGVGIEKVITASKHRDVITGHITHTEVPNLEDYSHDTNFIIVDDICDGGRTFIELSKVIKVQKPNSKIFLVVSHGIFSAGFEILAQHINHIFTTNSFRDLPEYEENLYVTHFVTQFKII